MNAAKKSIKVCIYARCSTHDQKAHLQLDALRELAERRGWDIAEEYIDLGQSGAKDKRPALDRLLRDAHRGRFSAVCVWKLDRLARSVRHLVVLADEFKALGIDLVSTQDAIDTTTPAGRFTFHVLGAVAELERELIRERTRAGLAAARKRGVRLGRKPVRLDLDRARELRANGKSFREIAADLGVSVGKVFKGVHESPSEAGSGEA